MIERVRRETPGCQHRLHFNNAGAALMPECVLEAQRRHLELEAQLGGYEAAELRAEEVENTYRSLGRLLNCDPSEIALMENATAAWLAAFHSIDWQPGDRILTSQVEYASNYISFLHLSRRLDIDIEVVASDEHGQVDLEALGRCLKPPVRLVALTHVPTNGGLVNPAAEVGKLARRAGVLYLLDACQSAGQLALDAEGLGCDMLSATARKFLRGPRGAGFLMVRRSALERLTPMMLDLHSATWVCADDYRIRDDARRFENWEHNYAGVLGLGAAVDYALELGLDWIEARVAQLAETLRDALRRVPGASVHDLGLRRCGIVTFTLAGHEPEAIRQHRLEQKINTSVTTRFSTQLDMSARGLEAVVRASPHYYNTEEEIQRLCDALSRLPVC